MPDSSSAVATQSASDALYGKEPRVLREWLAHVHAEYQAAVDEGRRAAAVARIVYLEACMLLLSLLLGPLFVWRASAPNPPPGASIHLAPSRIATAVPAASILRSLKLAGSV